MPLRPTRSAQPPTTHVLVYDGNCPFCTATSTWTRDHARQPIEIIPMADIEGTGMLTQLTHDELEATAHFITPTGIEYHGGEAITRSLRLVPFGRLAAILDLPGLTYLRDGGYLLVERSRPLLSKFIHP